MAGQDELIYKVKLEVEQDSLKQVVTDLNALTAQTAENVKKAQLEVLKSGAGADAVKAATRAQAKELKILSEAAASTGNTYNDLVARNKALSLEMKKLPLDDVSGKLAKLQADYKRNNDELKLFDARMGNHQRNVGNYADTLNGLAGGLKGLGGPVGQAGSAFMGLNTIMKANPAMLLVTIIVKLIGVFNNFQPVADALSATMAALGAAFQWVVDKGRALITGQDETTKSFTDTIKAAYQLEQAQKALFRQETENIGTKAKLRKEISDLRLATKGENITNKERIRLMDLAIAKEKEMLAVELAAAREEARIAKEKAALGSSSDEELRAVAEKQAKLVELETQTNTRLRELTSERLSVIRQAAAAELAVKRSLEAAKLQIEQEAQKQSEINTLLEADDLSAMTAQWQAEADAELAVALKTEQEKTRLAAQEARARGEFLKAIKIEEERQIMQLSAQFLALGMSQDKAAELAKSQAAIDTARKTAEAELMIERLKQQNKLALARAGFDLASALGALFFERNKKISIALALIDTFLGAQAAFAQTRGSIIIKSLAAASATAMGLARVKQIRNTKIGGGASTSSSMPRMASAPASTGFSLEPASTPATGMAAQSAGMASATSAKQQVIVVQNKIDRAGIATMVKEGNDELSARGVTVVST
jgi:hypothetical protein